MGKDKGKKFKVQVETYLQKGGVQFLVKKVEIKGDQFYFGIKKGESIDHGNTCSELVTFLKEQFGLEDDDIIKIKHENYNII